VSRVAQNGRHSRLTFGQITALRRAYSAKKRAHAAFVRLAASYGMPADDAARYGRGRCGKKPKQDARCTCLPPKRNDAVCEFCRSIVTGIEKERET